MCLYLLQRAINCNDPHKVNIWRDSSLGFKHASVGVGTFCAGNEQVHFSEHLRKSTAVLLDILTVTLVSFLFFFSRNTDSHPYKYI